ncbi:hypothetical protein TNCV_2999391, partial [Trichonephila clavipes]
MPVPTTQGQCSCHGNSCPSPQYPMMQPLTSSLHSILSLSNLSHLPGHISSFDAIGRGTDLCSNGHSFGAF